MTMSGPELIELLDIKAVEISNDKTQGDFIRQLSLAWMLADWSNKKILYASYWLILENMELIPKVNIVK